MNKVNEDDKVVLKNGERTFMCTLEDLKDVFRAGVRRGQDESIAWGSRAQGKTFDEMWDVFFDNFGMSYDDTNRMVDAMNKKD